MSKKLLIIKGSARKDSLTRQALQQVFGDKMPPLVDLNDKDISYYDYEGKNAGDDFLPLAEEMLQYDAILLATPTYWYSMSAQMKTFIDRWSDLISIRKDLGQQLKSKWMYVVTSYASEFPLGFVDAFRLTCGYLDMQFGGCYYHYTGKNAELLADNEVQAEAFKVLIDRRLKE